MTTDELVAQVLHMAPTYYPDVPPDEEDWRDYLAYFAPLLARKLERAMADLHTVANNQIAPLMARIARRAIAEIEAME